ncbi:MAG: hypothetical protein V4591_10070 [Bdellovibrionota bacterium]
MHNEPTWITLKDDVKENSLYSQILLFLNNKEELVDLLKAAGCTGVCTGPGGCK